MSTINKFIPQNVNCKKGIKAFTRRWKIDKAIVESKDGKKYGQHEFTTILLNKKSRKKKELLRISSHMVGDEFRSVSRVDYKVNSAPSIFHHIEAWIGNETGKIAIASKPPHISIKKAAQRIKTAIDNASFHPLDSKREIESFQNPNMTTGEEPSPMLRALSEKD